ncbi:hypothetical protein GCM10023322_84200 [Rugosimonospora acidiphila]|uniref:Uncharacterized protein n=1 Tax=Rugosimonospora acidiphila TaxID=556531 RepID=A0ABP9SW88_9ACTN
MAYASAYAVAAKLLTKLGVGELALLVADRSATAAVEADSLEARGLAAYHVACALLRLDRPEDTADLAVAMAAWRTGRSIGLGNWCETVASGRCVRIDGR